MQRPSSTGPNWWTGTWRPRPRRPSGLNCWTVRVLLLLQSFFIFWMSNDCTAPANARPRHGVRDCLGIRPRALNDCAVLQLYALNPANRWVLYRAFSRHTCGYWFPCCAPVARLRSVQRLWRLNRAAQASSTRFIHNRRPPAKSQSRV